MSVYPLFLVLQKDGSIEAFAREDILRIQLHQSSGAGEPARTVYKLSSGTLTVTYERCHEYAEMTLPLENLCQRHLQGALEPEFQTSRICEECKHVTEHPNSAVCPPAQK